MANSIVNEIKDNEQINVKTVQQLYMDFGEGNLDGVLQAMTADVIWKQSEAGPAPFSGTIYGQEQLREWFQTMDQVSEVEGFEPKEFIAQGDKVVVIGNYKYRSRSTGKAWESDWAMVWSMHNGKIAQGQIFEDTLAQANALSA